MSVIIRDAVVRADEQRQINRCEQTHDHCRLCPSHHLRWDDHHQERPEHGSAKRRIPEDSLQSLSLATGEPAHVIPLKFPHLTSFLSLHFSGLETGLGCIKKGPVR